MRALRVGVLVALTLTMAAPAQANHWRHRAFASPFSRPHDAGLLTVDVGSAPSVAALDSVTHTLYVPNENDGTISLIDTARCNIRRPAGCRNAAPTVPMGTNPVSITVDTRTRTVYVVGLGDHAVSVLDATRCNAVTTTGCVPLATVPQPGDPIGSAIDPVTDTIYVGNSLTRALSVIDGRSCNRVTPSACSAATGTAATGAAPILPYVDVASRTLYVPNVVDGTVSVIDVRACNGQVATGCATTPPALTAGNAPLEAIVDPATHTLYVDNDDDGTMSVFDASTCNAAITTGCGQTAPTTRMGPIPSGGFILHPASHSLIVGVLESDVLVVLDTAACHARATVGCESRWPTVRTGNVPYWIVHDPGTDTLYVSQYMDGEVSVLDAAACTALRRNGCRRTAPAIDVSNNNDIAISASQHTVYVADGIDHRLSMFDTDRCRADRLDRCAPVVVTVPRISGPARIAIDDATQTLYANNFDDRTTVVIDARRCNVSRQSGCVPVATAIATGPTPVGLAVDPVTHAVFVADVQDDTLLRFDGRHCNARDVSGCGRAPVTAPVGRGPWKIAVDPPTGSVYVSLLGDDTLGHTVSVVDGNRCCAVRATVGVGRFPQGMVVDAATRTLYVANQAFDDEPGSLSVVDLRHCIGADVSGCDRTPPRAPAGRGSNAVALDPATHTLYTADSGHSSSSVIDGARCNARNTSGCGRAPRTLDVGLTPFGVALDAAHDTLYVTNDFDVTVSIVQTSG